MERRETWRIDGWICIGWSGISLLAVAKLQLLGFADTPCLAYIHKRSVLRVKVLNGGLPRWQQLGFPVTFDFTRLPPKRFDAVFRPELFADLEQMKLIQQRGSKQILDARSEDSFNGQRPLHDADLLPGHIPGSSNIPYRKLFTPDDFTFFAEQAVASDFFQRRSGFKQAHRHQLQFGCFGCAVTVGAISDRLN